MEAEKRLDLIDRKALIAEYDRVHIGPPGGARKLIEDAPTVDAVEVVHGRWIKAECSEKDGNSNCSECGHWDWNDCNYCSHCGAKMDGRDNVFREEKE